MAVDVDLWQGRQKERHSEGIQKTRPLPVRESGLRQGKDSSAGNHVFCSECGLGIEGCDCGERDCIPISVRRHLLKIGSKTASLSGLLLGSVFYAICTFGKVILEGYSGRFWMIRGLPI